MPTRDKLPPCPDPGLKKPAMLHAKQQENAGLVKKTNSAGSHIYGALQPYLGDLALRRIFNKMITLLRTGFKKDGRLDVSVLRGLDLQKDYPLRKLVRGVFQWQHVEEDHVFRFRIDIPERNGALLKRNKQMKTYRFIIILVHGNPERDGSMKLKSVKSKEYSFEGTGTVEECLLELSYKPQPGQQWLFCLRAECMEGKKMASHPKSRALLILDGGRWE